MTLNFQKAAIDIGIITLDAQPMLAFYRDLLELPLEATIPMPGGGTMYRLKVGESVVKVIETEPAPPEEGITGGIRAATGYRYWTIHVNDLNNVLANVEKAGHEIAVAPRVIRPGVTIAMIVDPDGNWVELLHNE